MLAPKTFRLLLCSLCAGVLFTTACNEDDVLADVTCGDHVCNGDEDWSNCPGDCPETCGNGICNSGEDAQRCPGDCVADCGNGECDPDENAVDCPADCAGPVYPGPCTGDSTTTQTGNPPNASERFEYQIVDGNLRITMTRIPPEGYGLPSDGGNYLFDPEGRMIGYEQLSDGTVDWGERWFYDAEGRLVGSDTRTPEGELISETTHTYDATGYLESSYTESFAPGGFDTETIYEWNEDHTLCLEQVDEHADGSVTYTRELTYDALGNVVFVVDGQNQSRCALIYDLDNLFDVAPGAVILSPWRVTKLRTVRYLGEDCEDDGVDNGVRFSYDSYGNVLQQTYQAPGFDEPIHFTTYNYDCWM